MEGLGRGMGESPARRRWRGGSVAGSVHSGRRVVRDGEAVDKYGCQDVGKAR